MDIEISINETNNSESETSLCEKDKNSSIDSSSVVIKYMLFDTNTMNAAVYVKNRTVSRVLNDDKIPYEIWTGEVPNFNHLNVFGSMPKGKRRKLDLKSKEFRKFGYILKMLKPISIQCPSFKKYLILRSRDVIFIEGHYKDDFPTTKINCIPDLFVLQKEDEFVDAKDVSDNGTRFIPVPDDVVANGQICRSTQIRKMVKFPD